LHSRVMAGEDIPISRELICDFNRQVLKGLDLRDDVVPGEIRTNSVVVFNYRGAPAEDCAYLLDRLSDWLNDPVFISEDPEIHFALSVAKAVYAHLYLAWIHPFGDGNGRSARLTEFLILASCGLVPMPGAHLLSNHYNLTRPRYYQELARASEAQDALGFLNYAIEGFVDGIREVIDMVREQQLRIAWINFVHERFAGEPTSKATERQRSLVLAMPIGARVPRSELEGLTSKVSKFYANAGPRMLSRDLNHLAKMGLIRSAIGGYENEAETMLAFRPPIAVVEA
jgi:Fic family protein